MDAPTERLINNKGKYPVIEEDMAGLSKICKIYGSMDVTDKNGNKVKWVYDYANDKAVLKSEMTKEQFTESEKAKWESIKRNGGL